MAAGSGSRYGKLKQFDKIGPTGEFLMEFAMYDAIKSGFDHIVVITIKDRVDFLDNYLRQRLAQNIRLDVLAQDKKDLPNGTRSDGDREKPWGTAHAVWSARHIIDAPFIIVNADDFYGRSAYAVAAKFIQSHASDSHYALLSYTLKDTLSDHGSVSRGICLSEGDNLTFVDEQLELEQCRDYVLDRFSGNSYSGDEQVSMNFWVCKPTIFDKIESEFRLFLQDKDRMATDEIYLPTAIQKLLQSGEANVKLVPSQGDWFGVTYPSDKKRAMNKLQTLCAQNTYPSPLWP